ncbi:hypothetical protein [Halobaculum rarum]|uniref:hypothetical protein n=1 Tax=Halobaculum rarum TaxID=3075122 RepID=UPI0032AE8DB5
MEWIDSDYILENRQSQESFYIPEKGAEAAVLCLKDIIQNGHIKSEYTNRISEFAKSDPNSFKNSLIPIYGKLSQKILQLAIDGDFTKIEKYRFRLLRDIFQSKFTSKKLTGFIKDHIDEFFQRKGGAFISLIGPDGSGKSTTAEHLLNNLENEFVETKYLHGRPNIIPDLSSIIPLIEHRASSGGSTQRGAPSPLPRPYQYILIPYYFIDYLLFRLALLRELHRGKVIIADRYFYDYAIQPNGVDFDDHLYSIFSDLVPHPDLLIYLYASPEVIFNRKPELTTEAIERQHRIIEKIVSERSGTKINTESNFENTQKHLLAEINARLRK